MLSRRILLGGAAAVATASVAGCAQVPPLPGGPAPSGPPAAPAGPGQDAVAAVRALLDEASSAPDAPTRAALLAWARDVNAQQHEVVGLPRPAERTATPSASPASPTPSASAVASPTASTTATPSPTPSATASARWSALAEPFLALAHDPTSARPHVWASMAAWVLALGDRWSHPTTSVEAARTFRVPAPLDALAARQTARDVAAEALYALEVAAGAPGLTDADVQALAARRHAWADLGEDLAERAASATPSPTPAAPWFSVEPPRDAAGARALVARVEASALPVLGRVVAHGPADLREPLVAGLVGSARAVPAWGGLLQRWPGLPA